MSTFISIKDRTGNILKINKLLVVAVSEIQMVAIGEHVFGVSFSNKTSLSFVFESRDEAQKYWDMF